MAIREFVAFDSENLIVQSSSNGSLVGNPIINNSDTPNGTVFTYSAGSGERVSLDDLGGSPDTFEDDQSGNHTITDGAGLVTNGTAVEAESTINIQALDGDGNPTGPIIQLTVFSQNGSTGNVWGFGTTTLLEDGVSYIKISGDNAGSEPYSSFVSCFGPGSMIKTRQGEVPVQSLKAGDLVWTLDAGHVPLDWVGTTRVTGVGKLAPVVISEGAIGNARPLVVSQEHRMYVRDGMAELLFGAREVLIAAKHLCALPGVDIVATPEVTYTHFMFDSHHVVKANGILSESFFFSAQSVSGTARGPRSELLSLFPSLDDGIAAFGATRAYCLRKHEAALWCQYAAPQRQV